MRTTLKQIADATSLSVTIVSQVLNDRPCRVSKENRKLILKTAAELIYRPNLAEISLVKGSANTIGLAISDIRNNFFAMLAKGVEEEGERKCYCYSR
ncbi:MAG: LacI family DNA-binding transcriptional regulator [Lachnospiraceae bacterium]|nr:LacI family DNA-binding transcriptional regulator [Lachnospiraceae bacterium]